MTAYLLDMPAACATLKRLNASSTYAACERILDRHFSSPEDALAVDRIPELVVLIDGLWATQLYRDGRAADEIVVRLQEHRRSILEILSGLRPGDLVERPEHVHAAARELFPVILEAGTKQHYSFTTKFFHWLTREHFPIVDGNARGTINAFQRKHGVTEGQVYADTAVMRGWTYVDEYGRWIRFYSSLIGGMSEADKTALLAADYETQTGEQKLRASLLRILDKVFYGLGGGWITNKNVTRG